MSVHLGRGGSIPLECCILTLLLSPRVVVAPHKPKLLFNPASFFMPSSHSFVGVLQSSILLSWYPTLIYWQESSRHVAVIIIHFIMSGSGVCDRQRSVGPFHNHLWA